MDTILESAKTKSLETRRRMSLAKIGKKFSDEHKEKLSKTQTLRHELRKTISRLEPNLSKSEQWLKVKEMLREMK